MRLNAGGIGNVPGRESTQETTVENIVKKRDEEGGVSDLLIAKVTTKVVKKKPKLKAFVNVRNVLNQTSAEGFGSDKLGRMIMGGLSFNY